MQILVTTSDLKRWSTTGLRYWVVVPQPLDIFACKHVIIYHMDYIIA